MREFPGSNNYNGSDDVMMRRYDKPRPYGAPNGGASSSGADRARPGEEADDYGLFAHEKCTAPRAKIFLVTIISFAVAIAIVLVVVLTRIDETAPPTTRGGSDSNDIGCWLNVHCANTSNSEDDTCHDVIIVGGGLAGSYAAWRLATRNVTRSIVLYEATDRIGGRLHTRTFPNSSEPFVELGPASFMPYLDKLLNRTIEELGLETTKNDVPDNEFLYFLRGQYFDRNGVNRDRIPYTLAGEEQGLTAFELLRYALQKARVKYDPDEVLVTTQEPDSNNTNDGQDDGGPPILYQISLHDVLMEMLSYEAYNFLCDALPPNFLMKSGSAGVLWDKLTELETLDDVITFTLVDGMESLPVALVDYFNNKDERHEVRLNHQLVSVESTETITRLGFVKTETVNYQTIRTSNTAMTCAKYVVLAVPPEEIRNIKWGAVSTNKVLRENLESVLGVPSTKIVLSYDEHWWGQNSTAQNWTAIRSDLPLGSTEILGESFDLSTGSSKGVILQAVSTGETNFRYWQNLETGPKFENSVPNNEVLTQRAVEHAHAHLKRLLGVSQTLPEPSGGIYQYDATAWHVWKPGFDWLVIADRMIKPFEDQMIYIAGTAFAPGSLQQSIEGAVQTAEQAAICIVQSEKSKSRTRTCNLHRFKDLVDLDMLAPV